VNKNKPTPVHLNSLTDFRQQAYALLEKQHDGLFEILDAIVQTPAARSSAELSLAPAVTRRWPSIYSALADGTVNTAGLRELGFAQIPREKSRIHFALDVTAVRRMHSPTLKDRLFCHGAQREVAGKGLIIGLPHSILAYVQEHGMSWAPAVHTQRVKPDQAAVDVVLTQASWVAEQLPEQTTSEIALDGGDGNLKFFTGMRGLKIFATARMRNDRVLYQLPMASPKGTKKRGRSRKYGAEFRFAAPATWPAPDEVLEFEDPKFGCTRLE